MPYDPPPALAALTLGQIAEFAAQRKLPPVESWSPDLQGDSEMHITADGRWYHQGVEIRRPAMVRAFSALLRREADGGYVLMTPYEKLNIIVDDAPFVAVEMTSEGNGVKRSLGFRLNSDDLVVADAEHPIKLRPELPYLHVRAGLWAKIARPVYYELAEIALAEGRDPPSVCSRGQIFVIGASQ